MGQTVIGIRDLEVECIIGVWAHERTDAQMLLVDVAVSADVSQAAEHDDYRRTVDYAALAEGIKFILDVGRFKLLETACSAILQWMIHRRDLVIGPPIEHARIQIKKPSALPGTATAFVEAEYARDAQASSTDAIVSKTGPLKLEQFIIDVAESWTPPQSVNRMLIQGDGLEDRLGSNIKGEWHRSMDAPRPDGFTNHGLEPISVLFARDFTSRTPHS